MCDYLDSDSDEDLYKVKSKKLSKHVLAQLEKLENNTVTSDSPVRSKKKSKDKLNAISNPEIIKKPTKPSNTTNSQPDHGDDVLEVDGELVEVRGESPLPPSPPPPVNLTLSQDDDVIVQAPVEQVRKTRRSAQQPPAQKQNLNVSYEGMVRVTNLADTSIYEDNDDSIICLEDSEEGREMMVRVRSRSGIQRFNIKPNSRLNEIYVSMARHESVPQSLIRMYRNDVMLKASETPSSVGLTAADTIECYVVKQTLDSSEDPDAITLYVQSKSHRQKIAFKISQDDFMSKLMMQYAASQNLLMSTLTFRFDGETITGTETPRELGIDHGECIDAVVKT